MARIEIKTSDSKSYSVIAGNNLAQNFKEHILSAVKPQKAVVVTNEIIYELYENFFTSTVASLGFGIEYCILPDGEIYKNEQMLKKIISCAFEQKLERNDLFIAIGGGVIGDITGFAASIYLRGIKLIHIPTTLLAQVDSSIGGKTGINTAYGKNLLGTFYQPAMVLSDTNFLKTLPERELKTGLAEIIKYGFIEKKCSTEYSDFLQFLGKNSKEILNSDEKALNYIIEKSVNFKAFVVQNDEKEQGLRRVLNFGHTIGHAIEKVSNYETYTHGEAVALGIKSALYISKKLNKIDESYYKFAINLLDKFDLNLKLPETLNPKEITDAINYDKKMLNSKNHFVLPVGYGYVEVFEDINQEIILEAVKELY